MEKLVNDRNIKIPIHMKMIKNSRRNLESDYDNNSLYCE